MMALWRPVRKAPGRGPGNAEVSEFELVSPVSRQLSAPNAAGGY